MSYKDLSEAEFKALQRITRRNLNRRGRPRKACETPASRKRKWLKSYVGSLDSLEQRTPYCIPPWKSPLKVVIDDLKNGAISRHIYDSLTSARRIYADGSGINERIAAASVSPDY